VAKDRIRRDDEGWVLVLVVVPMEEMADALVDSCNFLSTRTKPSREDTHSDSRRTLRRDIFVCMCLCVVVVNLMKLLEVMKNGTRVGNPLATGSSYVVPLLGI